MEKVKCKIITNETKGTWHNQKTHFSQKKKSWTPQHTRKARAGFKITPHDADRGIQEGHK